MARGAAAVGFEVEGFADGQKGVAGAEVGGAEVGAVGEVDVPVGGVGVGGRRASLLLQSVLAALRLSDAAAGLVPPSRKPPPDDFIAPELRWYRSTVRICARGGVSAEPVLRKRRTHSVAFQSVKRLTWASTCRPVCGSVQV